MEHTFSTPLELAEELRNGRMIILVDDEDRENEGDMVVAGESATPETVNFMISQAKGLLCLAISQEYADRLELPAMSQDNTDTMRTAFTVSIDAHDTHTGISAYERSETIMLASDPTSVGADFRRPGHVFPIVAKPGGVLQRAGHTEASVDLAVMAGLNPAAAICEVVGEDGRMARLPQLMEFAAKHDLKLGTIASLIAYRRSGAPPIAERAAAVNLPTEYGTFELVAYETGNPLVPPPLALVMGDLGGAKPPLVRIHSECMTGDLFGSLRCDCGPQLHTAMAMIAEEGRGAIVYLRQEGRGIGLVEKLKAYNLQDKGLDTVDANIALGFAPDLREYGMGAAILADLGIGEFRLITNNPKKVSGLSGYGLRITETVPLVVGCSEENDRYFQTKRNRMGHMLPPVCSKDPITQ